MQDIEKVKQLLLVRVSGSETPREVLKAPELKQLYGAIKDLPPEQRGDFGKKVNELKLAVEKLITDREAELESKSVEPIDITAPWDINCGPLELLPADKGSQHPLTKEIETVTDIFTRMGFEVIESRQIDDDYHMFESLNFPDNHPARDGYDTFRTEENFIAPAHTSTMQNRILKANKEKLAEDGYIGTVAIGRCFRNEDLDATHEHTFHQFEGVFVSKSATLGEMLGTLRSFFEVYYGQKLKIKTQPSYFPFVEPGLEFTIEKPAALGGNSPFGEGEWLEMLGCGMIHPNVLKEAGIDPTEYRGFAWGGGIERLIMLKYGIEDIRHFESGKLAFLREFA
jgi:phenylalanyl-tRNA synthetase alpha chain